VGLWRFREIPVSSDHRNREAHLRRSFPLVLTVLALAACSDASSPPPKGPRKVYVLVSVNGAPLPAILASGSLETTWALRGTLTLGPGDSATEVLVQRDSSQWGDSQGPYTMRGRFKITGDSIATGFFGHCRDICPPNRIGIIADSTVSLTYEVFPPSDPVYVYRIQPDP
jgi:hypothetical protein